MQLLRYRGEDGAPALGVYRPSQVISVERALRRYLRTEGRLSYLQNVAQSILRDPRVLLALTPAAQDLIAEATASEDGTCVVSDSLDALHLLPFVPNPEKVFGLGYNYRALCEKEGVAITQYPQLFVKMPTSVTGAWADIHVPPSIDKVDFEAELCVVVGRTARNVQRERALEYVGGYTIMNDVTAKILPRPKLEAQTTTVVLKGIDNFAPLGATVVTPDEVRDPSMLWMVSCVNGEERQRYSASDMVHDVAATLAYTSSLITLHPGDLIAMGTSLGIGIVEVPPRLLNDGDVVECAIEGYPGCRNTFRIPAQRTSPANVPAEQGQAGGTVH